MIRRGIISGGAFGNGSVDSGVQAKIKAPFIPINQPITDGQTIQQAFESTQGQINAIVSSTPPFVHNQATASLNIIINHNTGAFISSVIFDDGITKQVESLAFTEDGNTVTFNLDSPFVGNITLYFN